MPAILMIENVPTFQIEHDGLTIAGYSRAAVQTCWRVPELELGFDLGALPSEFAETPTWFLSHCHLDHLAALPLYVARRRLLGLPPPHVFLPEQELGGVRRLLKAYEALEQQPLDCELAGLAPGDEVKLTQTQVVSAFATRHTIPSLGFVVWERQPHEPAGQTLLDVPVEDEAVRSASQRPLVCYTGDTAPQGLDENPVVFEAKILITEVTFVDPRHRRNLIRKHGHLHLDDFVMRSDQFRNDLIIAAHVTARSSPAQVRRQIARTVPSSLKERFRVWI